MDEELYAVAPQPEHGGTEATPIALRALASQPLVMPSRPNALRMLLERQMADIGCQPVMAMEIDGVPAILDMVTEGVGYAVLPGHAVQTASHPGRYLLPPIHSPRVVGQVYLVTSARRATTLTQQAMIDLIHELVSRLAPQPLHPTDNTLPHAP